MYLAARYDRREEMVSVAGELGLRGIGVTSRWIRGLHDDVDDNICASDDMEDVREAQVLIAFTETPGAHGRGGRHVETGLALGIGMPVIVVGPAENVFHSLCFERYETTAELLGAIEGCTWPGICSDCACTDANACVEDGAGACGWSDDAYVLCTSCAKEYRVSKALEEADEVAS